VIIVNNGDLFHEIGIKQIDLDIKCPICGRRALRMLYKSVDIPYIGAMVLSTIICIKCGFKVTDFWMVFEKGKYEDFQKVKITKSTINDLICVSAGSKIIVPEIDAEIDVITFDSQDITTIEGLLWELKKSVEIMIETAEDRAKAERILKILDSELKVPTGKLTLVIEDPNKHSAIIPHKYWVQRVEREREFTQEYLDLMGKKIIEKWKDAAIKS